MTNTTLKLEINSLPKDLRAQVADFVEFLKKKSKTKSNLKVRELMMKDLCQRIMSIKIERE